MQLVICAKTLTEFIHVGGITLTPNSSTDWYWITTGEKIAYEMTWNCGELHSNAQFCLSIETENYLYVPGFTSKNFEFNKVNKIKL